MAKLRKAGCYTKPKRPYTRKSKKREKSYVRGAPYSKIVSFDMGNKKNAQEFKYKVQLISKTEGQIRHNALESARVAVNKKLSTDIGVSNYYFKIRLHPHNILRENAQAAGAGADRFSTGMSHSFGKPVGLAAQVKMGQILLEVRTEQKYLKAAKEAIGQARYKFPVPGRIIVKEGAK